MSRLLVFLGILLTAHVCECYHILVIFPFPGKSHSILGYGYVNRLLEDGHEVTFITPFPKKNTNPKLHIIDVSENLKILPEEAMSLKLILEGTVNTQNFTRFINIISEVNQFTFNNPGVQKMLHDDKIKFDLVILEWMMSEFAAAYAAYYDVPYIFSTSTEPHSVGLSLIDAPTNPAYVPGILSSELPPFTFVQRVKNLIFEIVMHCINKIIVGRNEAAYYEETFAPLIAKKGRIPPSLYDLKYNASLILGNSHVSLGSAVRLPRSYKPIGGYHIDDKVPPLPEDLKKILDSAENGVIYFSMGSNLKSKLLPDVIKADLLKLFGSLKQTVIWKFEEVLPNLPKNVHILQWAPQPSILAHPNTILFITHGGLLSTTETIHFGVPVIGIPVFGDQFTNVDRSQQKGYALRVDLSYNMAADLKVAIEEMLNNPKYTEKVKELSFIYHDRPASAGAELAHWVRHVVRTRGATHLRSPALSTAWYHAAYLDLVALVLLILGLFVLGVRAVCCNAKKQTKQTGKKKRD